MATTVRSNQIVSKTEKSSNSNRSILFRTIELNIRIKAIGIGCLWREPQGNG